MLARGTKRNEISKARFLTPTIHIKRSKDSHPSSFSVQTLEKKRRKGRGRATFPRMLQESIRVLDGAKGRKVRFPGDAQGERPFNVPRLRSLLPRGNGIGNLLASHRDFASRLLSRHACDRDETRVNQPTRCKGSG